MGERLFGQFEEAMSGEPVTSIRINPAKCGHRPEGGVPVGWCREGYYLEERPNFTFDPLLHAGWYYVQEASSMFLDRVLRQYVTGPVAMLDLCAAPGGKSTTAMAALPAGSVLVSNEPVRLRAQILAENMQKWGRPETIVTNNYPGDFARSGIMFDVVLCDVPCSGEGMFRKDAGAVSEWSAQNVENCRMLQRGIAADAWRCLRGGGLMIYSTCTFNARENEDNVKWICSELGAEALPVDTESEWGITGALTDDFCGPVFRFIPGVTRGEGLFMAVLRKTESCPTASRRIRTRRSTKPADAGVHKEWLDEPDRFEIVRQGDAAVAVPKEMSGLYAAASETLRIVHAGVTMGRMKGRDMVPDHSLALSTALRRGAFATVGLDYDRAVDYLRRETVGLPDGTPRGFVLMTYGDAVIGFEKNIGNRANNMYPQEWRIKSSHVAGAPLLPIKNNI